MSELLFGVTPAGNSVIDIKCDNAPTRRFFQSRDDEDLDAVREFSLHTRSYMINEDNVTDTNLRSLFEYLDNGDAAIREMVDGHVKAVVGEHDVKGFVQGCIVSRLHNLWRKEPEEILHLATKVEDLKPEEQLIFTHKGIGIVGDTSRFTVEIVGDVCKISHDGELLYSVSPGIAIHERTQDTGTVSLRVISAMDFDPDEWLLDYALRAHHLPTQVTTYKLGSGVTGELHVDRNHHGRAAQILIDEAKALSCAKAIFKSE